MDDTIFIKSWSEVGVNALRSSGKTKVTCPSCNERRRDKRDRSLSINIDKGVGHCHYCNVSYAIEKPPERKPFASERRKEPYVRPAWTNRTELSEKLVRYFEGRRIRQTTLVNMRITEGLEHMPQAGKKVNTVQFNYFLEGELVNVKYRTGDKHFKMTSGAELIPYNMDAIRNTKECIITEGEFDCLSFIECGYAHTVSVPNGASANTSYLDEHWDAYFEEKETVYIAVDTDKKGVELRDELVRRFGAERCRIVTYGDDCKDANELLVKYGEHRVREAIECAEYIRVEGVFTVSDFEPELDLLYEKGMPRGLTVGHVNFDALCSFETKRVCVVTGIPGCGKSEFVDEILERMNILHEWKSAYFSPENYPLTYHASKLTSRLTGKPFGVERMPLGEYRAAKTHINRNFFFIYPKEVFSVDTILEKARYLIRRHGVKAFVIDPWNRLEHQVPSGMTETNYISQTLDRMTNFAQRNDALVILVAHPRKMSKNATGQYDMPTLYDINGSANFFNKADYGLSVHRDRASDTVTVGVQKVKFRHLGTTGEARFKYNINNGRYAPYAEGKDVHWDNTNHLTERIRRLEDVGMEELPFERYDGEKIPF